MLTITSRHSAFYFARGIGAELPHRIVDAPGVQKMVKKNGAETEKNRDRSSNCDVYITCDDVHYF